MDESGSGQRLAEDACEHCNEPLVYIKCEYFRSQTPWLDRSDRS